MGTIVSVGLHWLGLQIICQQLLIVIVVFTLQAELQWLDMAAYFVTKYWLVDTLILVKNLEVYIAVNASSGVESYEFVMVD